MSPPKKKARKDSEKAAKLKEIEEKRLAIEMERKKREQEMAELLAEQERLRQALEADDGSDEEGEEEGEVPDTDTGEVVDTDTGELPDTDTGELPDTDSGEVHDTDSAVDAKSEVASSAAPSAAEQSVAERSELSSGEIRTTDAESEPVIPKQAPFKHKPAPPVISAPKKSEPAPNRNGIAVSDTQYEVYGNKMFGNLYKERETKFFVVKSANIENVELAMEKKMWITSKVNEIRFNEAVAKHTSVLIFFSVQGSGAFQGVARLCGKSNKDHKRLPWSLPSNMPIENMSYQLQIDWISQQEMKFDNFTHLRNTWNRNKLVKVARDGQEISWRSGCSLGMLFPLDGSCDYDELVGKMKKRRSEIGPKQPPTASSRSARRKKHTDRPTRVVARGVNPAGFKRPNPRSGSQNNRGPPNKRRRFDNHPGSGANSAPLGNQQTVPSGITSLFDL